MQLRVGIIGCGVSARSKYIPQCMANPRANLVALCDQRPRSAARTAQAFGISVYADHRQMLADADIDSVIVAGPTRFHALQSIDALNAGKHVLCQMPMATTREEAREMMETAARAGKSLMVDRTQRISPVFSRAKEILSSGRLGKILSFRAASTRPNLGCATLAGNESRFGHASQEILGAAVELGLYEVDSLRWLLEQDVVEIGAFQTHFEPPFSRGNHFDQSESGYFTLKTAHGVVGSFLLSLSNVSEAENYIVLYCENGVMGLGVDPDFPIVVSYSNGDSESHGIGNDSYPAALPYANAIESFTQSILTKNQPKLDADEGYKSLDLILTSMEAGRAGRILKIGAAA